MMGLEQLEFLSAISQTISFEYLAGSAMKEYNPHITSWRNMPFTVIVHVNSGLYFCEIEGKERINISKDSTIIVPPGIKHRVGMDEKGILSHAHIHFTIVHNLDILSMYNIPLVVEGSDSQNIYERLASLYDGYSKSEHIDICQMVLGREQGLLLLYHILELSELKSSIWVQLAKLGRITGVLKYIEQHLAEELSRSVLSDLICLSPTRFHYVFKEAIGISPMEYIFNIRMSKAQKLLITTDLPINCIGAEVGYAEPSEFSKAFKGRFGISPLKYRQGYSKHQIY